MDVDGADAVQVDHPGGVGGSPAAERIATDLVTHWEASDSDAQVVDVVVDRYEDHDTFWRVTLHADLRVGRDKLPMTYYYQIDVDKQTATPSLYNQG